MNWENHEDAIRELRQIESDGYELEGVLEPDAYDSISKYLDERVNLFRILGRIDCRKEQDTAVNNFGACYTAGLRQGVDGEAIFTLAKCFKLHLAHLIRELEADIKVSRTWTFHDRRVIKWVDRWENACECLKESHGDAYERFFEEE